MNWSEICAAATPEFYLAIVGLIAVLLGAILREKFTGISLKFSAVVLLGAAILSVLNLEGGTAFNGLWETDAYTNIAKAVCYFCTAIALLLAESYLFKEKLIRFEYCLLVIFASLGMGIMLSANDLMTLYLGIETLGLSSYVLAAFNRDSQRSSEAGQTKWVGQKRRIR